MQCHRVIVIGRVVLDLQPVGMLKVAIRHEFVALGDGEIALPVRKWGFFIWGAHVGKHQTMALYRFVRPLTDRATITLALFLLAFRERHTQAGAVDIKHHAVIAARDAMLLNLSIFKRRAAVYAMR